MFSKFQFDKKFVSSDSATIFLEVFADLQEILATNEAFLLGKWLNDAKSAATNEQVSICFVFKALLLLFSRKRNCTSITLGIK